MERRRPDTPVRRGGLGSKALLGALVAAALLGAVLIVAGVDSGAQAQDTPTEDAPAEDAPTEDVPGEDSPTEDVPADVPIEDVPADVPIEEVPAEDSPAEDTPPEDDTIEDGPADDVSAEDSSTEDVPAGEAPTEADGAVAGEPATGDLTVPRGPHSVTSGHYGCPQRPPSRYHDDVPSWSDWCLDLDHWIVEVSCGPTYANAGLTVRFDAEPPSVLQPLMYDLCGNSDLIGECPPVVPVAEPSPAAVGGRNEAGVPAVDPDQAGEGAADLGDAIEQVPSPDELLDTAVDLFAGTGGADDIDETIDASLEADEITDVAIAPPVATASVAAADDETGVGGAADESCGPVWPPGAWYQFTRQDPITGVITAGGQATGSWLGPRHHATADAPSFVVRCAAGRLGVVVHTGGVVVAAYGHGIPVQHRVGDTVRFEEWNEFDTGSSPRAGVSLPPWSADAFVALLGQNPEGELLIRVLAHDGAEVGLAEFDLAMIDRMMEPIREICPAPAPAAPADEA